LVHPPPRKCWESVATRCVFRTLNVSECVCGRGSAPDRAEGAYSDPQQGRIYGEGLSGSNPSSKMLGICCHEMRFGRRKCIKMRLWPGLRPRARRRSSQRSPSFPILGTTFVDLFAKVLLVNAFVQKIGLVSRLIRVLHKVFICLCIWAVKLHSLDWLGLVRLGECCFLALRGDDAIVQQSHIVKQIRN